MVDFINKSPTPFHAVAQCVTSLKAKGFEALCERDAWVGAIKPGGKYYFTRNLSTIVAFTVGNKYEPGNRFKVVGCHTDSPVLKLKPHSNLEKHGYTQIGVECYGGGLWHTWFDRDLSVAGRVVVETDGKYESQLVKINRPICRIANLAIHLQTADERTAFKVNKEDHLAPLLALAVKRELGLEVEAGTAPPEAKKPKKPRVAPELLKILANELQCAESDIRDFELQLYDTQDATIGGASEEFVFAPRLDNLSSCYVALEALLEHSTAGLPEDGDVSVVVFFDHEEVGSQSAQGAGGPVIRDALERVSEALMGPEIPKEMHKVALSKSFVLSSDTAHAIHPNYSAKHEGQHQPKMCDGTVIKTNQNQRYATNMLTGFFALQFKRSWYGTIALAAAPSGPIISSVLGVRAVDIGAPLLSMHSIREQLACDDMDALYALKLAFFSEFDKVDQVDIEFCRPCPSL